MRILSLFIQYGNSDYKDAYQALMKFYARFQGVYVESVLIDTSLQDGVNTIIGPHARMISGNNDRREFSGWDTALGMYRCRLHQFDLVHFVTSAFENEYNGFYSLICQEMLEYISSTPSVMLAHIDAYSEPVRLLGRSFQTWGCSKFLFARPSDLLKLGGMVGPFSMNDFFPKEYVQSFRKDAPLSLNYQNNILEWLTGNGLPQGKWHSVFEYSDENIPRFRSKALSIIDEHSLSMRVRECGVRIVDYSWWYANRAKVWKDIPPEEINQVQERNVFLFGNPIVKGIPLPERPLDQKPELSELLSGAEGLFSGKLADALISSRYDVAADFSFDKTLVRAAHLINVGYGFSEKELEWCRAISQDVKQDVTLPITRGLHAVWLARTDLHQTLDLGSYEGRCGLIVWWIHARRIDTFLQDLIPAEVLLESDPVSDQDTPLPITRGLHAEWLAREDLRQTLDLTTPEGRTGLIVWWVRTCQTDIFLQNLIPDEIILEPDSRFEQDVVLPITRGLYAEWLARSDLQESIKLDTRQGRESLIAWWFIERQNIEEFDKLISQKLLSATATCVEQDGPFSITAEAYLTWLTRNDLRRAFDLSSKLGRQDFCKWLQTYGYIENKRAVSCKGVHNKSYKENYIGSAISGVNIIGYGRGEFGIGEDVRMAVQALDRVNIDLCVPLLPLKIAARQGDFSLRGYEVPIPLFRTNLICVPHYETLRILGATRQSILNHRYNICFWQWELAQYPAELRCAFNVADEIWSSSNFTAEAMRVATSKPVFQMPMVVSLPKALNSWGRADFGFLQDEFIFLTALDGNSSLRRKNPLATVRAFLSAFTSKQRVRLVVKAMNVSDIHPEWVAVKQLAEKNPKVTILAETMTKDRFLGLQSVCDCFVSLHRAEGFGRNIAEAMALGKPVIVSDYSGNKDFTSEETAFLVSGNLVPVMEGDYPFGDTQTWFEPEHDIAVHAFRKCLLDTNTRISKANAGKEIIDNNYSAKTVAAIYEKRFKEIGII